MCPNISLQFQTDSLPAGAFNRLMKRLFALLLFAALAVLQAPVEAQQSRIYSQAELDALLAPVALYPDPVLSNVLIAATYPDDLRDAAIRLEEFWNDLAKLQTFSLLCAYYMDNLDASAYLGPLECVCKVHTHLIPAADYAAFNEAVIAASNKVLEQPLAQMLLSLSAAHRPSTAMPAGQATLLWLKRNMPRTADKVLAEVRATVLT